MIAIVSGIPLASVVLADEKLAPEIVNLLEAWPAQEPLLSHYPVPLVYAEWEDAVTKRFGSRSLARYNEHLYEDLSPCKARSAEVPINAIAARLVDSKTPAARKQLADALVAPSEHHQWSVVGALDRELIDEFAEQIITIAKSDAGNTDRAFAYRAIANSSHPDRQQVLECGLFDDYLSVRLLCMELLGQIEKANGDGLLLMPIKGLNPFHFYFVGLASLRALPDVGPDKYFRMRHGDKIDALNTSMPSLKADWLNLARKNRDKTYAQMALWLHGMSEESQAAEVELFDFLLDQGTRDDTYHSNEFWLRSDLIRVFSLGDDEQMRRLVSVFREHLAEDYDQQKDILLLTLIHAFWYSPQKGLEDELVQVGGLPTKNDDLRLGAALALSTSKTTKAFPALIKIIENKRLPFSGVALSTLERISGVETPNKPPDHGILHKIGVPKKQPDYQAAAKFWSDWYAQNREDLRYDEENKRFVVTRASSKD